MSFNFSTQRILEGTTNVWVPKVLSTKGPKTKKVDVFYNPTMEFNRDVSVIFLKRFIKKEQKSILDGLAATGIRGIRFANEVDGDLSVTINDANPIAFKLIKRNIRANNLENVIASNKKLNALLAERWYDYIDIDPFGSPVPFLSTAMQSVKNNGIIAITATDTAPLCGTYPKACRRRYQAVPLKTNYCHEIGLRILIGYVAKEAAKYDLAVKPLLSHYTDHYFRTYVRIEKGAKKTDKCLEKVGFVVHKENGFREVIKEIKEEDLTAGPLWIGSLFDEKFLKNLKIDISLGTKRRLERMLEVWKEEASAPPLYYSSDEIAKALKLSPPPLQIIIQKLRDEGYKATRTHFAPAAFKTDADIESIKEVFKITLNLTSTFSLPFQS